MIFLLFSGQTFAKSFNVLVLPVDIISMKENYYAFEDVSEIISKDVISEFAKTTQIFSPDLYIVREKMFSNPNLKAMIATTLQKYKDSGTINYELMKKISKDFDCNSVLIISSYAMTSHNSMKRSLWDVLDFSSVYNVSYPYKLESSAVLLDTVNDMVMWSGAYSKKVGNNDDVFAAKNYTEANAYLENIKFYSKNIVAKDVSQNIILRFFPKSVRAVGKTPAKGDDAGTLRFERNIPSRPEKAPQGIGPDNYGEMILGI